MGQIQYNHDVITDSFCAFDRLIDFFYFVTLLFNKLKCFIHQEMDEVDYALLIYESNPTDTCNKNAKSFNCHQSSTSD